MDCTIEISIKCLSRMSCKFKVVFSRPIFIKFIGFLWIIYITLQISIFGLFLWIGQQNFWFGSPCFVRQLTSIIYYLNLTI
jgi:hypothetical protein